jgi:NitT/TauT family transport system substrate-binding protein
LQAVLSRNTAAKPELEAERLQMVIARNLLTPWVKANGLGGIDTVRWQGMLDQIADAAPLKDRAKAAEAFAAGYLPAEAERLF